MRSSQFTQKFPFCTEFGRSAHPSSWGGGCVKPMPTFMARWTSPLLWGSLPILLENVKTRDMLAEKSLYGACQAGKIWGSVIYNYFLSLFFKARKCDPRLYFFVKKFHLSLFLSLSTAWLLHPTVHTFLFTWMQSYIVVLTSSCMALYNFL